MPERIDRVHARCESCDKGYRVPDATRAYTCKACGGVVRVPARHTRRSHLEDAITCGSCHAINVHDESSCVECGAALEGSVEAVLTDRRQATYALKRGYRWITGVTWMFRLGAAAYAFVTLIAVGALGRSEVPEQAGMLVVALTTLLTVLMLMGALQILFRPFAWTLIVATLASAVAAAHWFGPNPLGLMFFWTAGWAGAFWLAVVPTHRFGKLMDQHEDFYITHHASVRTRRSLKGRTPEQRHERLVGAMRRAARRAWKLSAAAATFVVLASGFGTYTVLASVRPPTHGAARQRFEAAWNRGDLDGVGAFFPAALQAQRSLWLAGVTEGHGWADALPELSNGVERTDEEADRVWIDYDLGGVDLTVGWTLDRRRWVLVDVELPVPPLEPALERFRVAWAHSDAHELASFYAPEHVERMRDSIERTTTRRHWQPYPAIVETDASDYEDGRADVAFLVADGPVTTRWAFRPDGTWGLEALRFPKSAR